MSVSADVRATAELPGDPERARLVHDIEAEPGRFYAILQQLPCAVVVAEAPTGRIIFSNREAERVYGRPIRTPASLAEDAAAIAFHPDGRPYDVPEYPIVRALAKGETVAGEEMEIRRNDGSRGPVVVSASPIRDEHDTIVGAVGTFSDVSDRKRVESEYEDVVRRQRSARIEAEAAQRRLGLLAEISQFLLASLDYQAAITGLARMVLPALGDACFVYIEGDNERRRLAAAHVRPAKAALLRKLDEAGSLTALAGRAFSNALRTGKPERGDRVTGDGADSPGTKALLEAIDPRAYMVIPLVTRGRVLGAMVFLVTESERTYSVGDLDFAQHVARRAALAGDNLRLYEEARFAQTAAEEANRIKDEFLATLSHELRTPLNAILGWARMLRSRTLEPATRDKALGTIERNALAQAQIVEDLLDVSRIVTGSLRLNLQSVDVVALMDSAINAIRPAAEAKGIRVETHVTSALAMVADHGRLQQVVWNLLSNATKFTPPGGRIDVRVDTEGPDVRIVVSDTGVGIGRAFLPHVFERFRQADSTTTRVHGGLGLGLAIVRHLVELHGGTVEADSQGAGRGATFTVRLPIRKTVPVRPAPSRGFADVDRPPDDLAGVDVLVVDDEADTRELVATILRDHGATVRMAASAEDALRLLASHTPSVLVADIAMPGQDGYTLVRQLRGDRTGVPAVALTAYARPEDRRRALDAGFEMHLPKPFEPDELVGAVADLAGRSREPR